MARCVVRLGFAGLALVMTWGAARPAISAPVPRPGATPKATKPAGSGSIRKPPIAAAIAALFGAQKGQPAGGPTEVAVLVTRRGETLYASGPGLAGREPKTGGNGPDLSFSALFPLFVTVETLKLAEGGRLRLDEPVVRHLPELRGWGEAITARHLLQDTAGLSEGREEAEGPDPLVTASGIAALAGRLRARGLAAPPGTRYEESPSSTALLAALIERRSGPSGLRETAIHGSLPALALFDRGLFGGTLLHPSSLQEMFAPARLANGERLGRGMGWEILSDPESGEIAYAWEGRARKGSAYYLRDPRWAVSVVLLDPSAKADLERLAFATLALMRKAVAQK